jgi:voltage-dependent potassium channel beta subunit
MNYRRLGDAGVKISEIGLGGWLTFGNAIEPEQGREVMDKAFDVGINFFDTADGYGRGKAETVWGEIFRHRRRQDYVLATKVFFPMSDNINDRGLSRKHIMESIDASLARLRTDYIDLYQCHRHDPDTPMEETVRAMDDLVRGGKILYWGFSEWPLEAIEKCLRICGDRYYKPAGSQPRYNLLHRDIEDKIMPLCAKAGIGQVVFSPLQQGILSGKYKPGQPAPASSRAADDKQNQFIRKSLENEELLKKVQRLAPIAREIGCTMSQLALAWNLRRPEVSCCIMGATRPEQVEQNAAASGIKLDEAIVRKMEEAVS